MLNQLISLTQSSLILRRVTGITQKRLLARQNHNNWRILILTSYANEYVPHTHTIASLHLFMVAFEFGSEDKINGNKPSYGWWASLIPIPACGLYMLFTHIKCDYIMSTLISVFGQLCALNGLAFKSNVYGCLCGRLIHTLLTPLFRYKSNQNVYGHNTTSNGLFTWFMWNIFSARYQRHAIYQSTGNTPKFNSLE